MWETEFWNNSIQTWIMAAGTAVLSWLIIGVAFRVIKKRFKRFAEKSENKFDDVVFAVFRRTKSFTLLLLAIYLGTIFLTLPDTLSSFFNTAIVVIVLIQAALWGNAAITALSGVYRELEKEGEEVRQTTVTILSFLGRVILFSVILLLVLDNLGIDVTALVASVGIGGMAIALAVQNILSDLFASLSISLDKPFVTGDFIIVDDLMGTVEQIGMKTTRLRSISGEQLIFSNNDLLKSRIRNYKRMYERRVVYHFGVTYETPREKLEKIPGIAAKFFESNQKVRYDRTHFKSLGDFALTFETVFFMLDPDYALFMDTQQELNFYLMKEFEERNIEFAYPTQKLFLETGSQSSLNQ